MLRRRASDTSEAAGPGSAPPRTGADPGFRPAGGPEAGGERPGRTPAKGRPTPKRSVAEKRRRQPYTAPTDRKTAGQRNKAAGRASRQARMAAMRRGEEWALPRRDQGKVRALARDYVDSRRSISEYYLFGVVALIILLFIPGLRQTLVVDYVVLVVIVVIVVEGYFIGRRVLRLTQQRYPGETTQGVRLYAAMRNTQFRKMRMPPPRVNIGDKY